MAEVQAWADGLQEIRELIGGRFPGQSPGKTLWHT
ncbi:hypothetical protein M2428_000975 [Arthrobacter sp. ES3-54]|nr:hypothetical protein [Arthrobacter sp. ES3-54]